MCKKQQEYEKVRIEICRNCLGAGRVGIEGDRNPGRCPVCGGSGRMKKTTKGCLVVEPYAGDQHAVK